MNKALRISRIVISVIIFAILCAGLTCSAFQIPIVGSWLKQIQLVPAIMSMTLFVCICWLIVTLIFGRIYCSTICPMGTLQDIASRSIRMGKSAKKHTYRYQPANNKLRYLFLTLMLACLLFGITSISSALDPYSAFSRICKDFFNPIITLNIPAIVATIIATVLFIITTVVATHSGRILCNTICPVGTTLGLISRFSIYQIDIDTDKCLQCRKCEHVCKSSCINLTDHVVDSSRCVNCFNCINVCPNDAIHYTAHRKQLAIPMMQRTDATTSNAESLIGKTDTYSQPNDKSVKK